MIFMTALAVSILGLGGLAVLCVWCAWQQGWKDEGDVMRREDERYERDQRRGR